MTQGQAPFSQRVLDPRTMPFLEGGVAAQGDEWASEIGAALPPCSMGPLPDSFLPSFLAAAPARPLL